jgi:hypothetical protein
VILIGYGNEPGLVKSVAEEDDVDDDVDEVGVAAAVVLVLVELLLGLRSV